MFASRVFAASHPLFGWPYDPNLKPREVTESTAVYPVQLGRRWKGQREEYQMRSTNVIWTSSFLPRTSKHSKDTLLSANFLSLHFWENFPYKPGPWED
ncbi:hypothetical protein AV530_013651 [Patagioenas fasciata monilis]|uniref:Uncharacterized protein n=1 Tax=Patagioenas fasciata monilis TaxID=372326 RepID=A0A1V4J7B5_PATFA|nr:hypothetical protein AV530_013651 [Patagioenas fasciata monilis]